MSSEHKPFVADSTTIPELTPIALVMGAVLGIVFGASSLYLALKVGMTVSASIPVAVLSITLFRAFSNMFGLRRGAHRRRKGRHQRHDGVHRLFHRPRL